MEDATLYGLPPAMRYGIMNEYAINKDSGELKARFNELRDESGGLYARTRGNRHAE